MTKKKKPEKKLKLKKETLKKLTVDKVQQAGGMAADMMAVADCCAYGSTAVASASD